MRSRYLPDGSIDYDADRALEILRNADEELVRQHQAQQEEALRMAASDHRASVMVTKTPRSAAVHAKVVVPDLLEDPLKAFTKTGLLELVPDPFTTTPPPMTADQTRTQP